MICVSRETDNTSRDAELGTIGAPVTGAADPFPRRAVTFSRKSKKFVPDIFCPVVVVALSFRRWNTKLATDPKCRTQLQHPVPRDRGLLTVRSVDPHIVSRAVMMKRASVRAQVAD